MTCALVVFSFFMMVQENKNYGEQTCTTCPPQFGPGGPALLASSPRYCTEAPRPDHIIRGSFYQMFFLWYRLWKTTGDSIFYSIYSSSLIYVWFIYSHIYIFHWYLQKRRTGLLNENLKQILFENLNYSNLTDLSKGKKEPVTAKKLCYQEKHLKFQWFSRSENLSARIYSMHQNSCPWTWNLWENP